MTWALASTRPRGGLEVGGERPESILARAFRGKVLQCRCIIVCEQCGELVAAREWNDASSASSSSAQPAIDVDATIVIAAARLVIEIIVRRRHVMFLPRNSFRSAQIASTEETFPPSTSLLPGCGDLLGGARLGPGNAGKVSPIPPQCLRLPYAWPCRRRREGDSYPQLTCLFLHAGVERMTAGAYTT
ncbi:hypothetical protein FB009_12423 [Sinorhizobium medicae]|nr:hypothetical protein FB009_12423 [Sinorhizobium medicae]